MTNDYANISCDPEYLHTREATLVQINFEGCSGDLWYEVPGAEGMQMPYVHLDNK